MRVLVAGGGGLVGSAIIRNSPNSVEIFSPAKSELDLSKHDEVKDYLFENRIEAIFLAAAKVGGILANSIDQWDFLLGNLQIQNAVISSAKELRIQNLIFLGSSCAYPKYAPQPISESELMNGKLEHSNEGYAIAKIAGIRLCKAAWEEYGLNYTSLMPTNLYGLNDNFNILSAHAPAALMRKFYEAKKSGKSTIEVLGSGKPKREFMSSEDLARACWFFLGKNLCSEIINIGTGKEVTIRELAELLAEISGFQGTLHFNLEGPDGTPRKILDSSKALSLGWSSQIELKVGLSKTYKWFENAYETGDIRGI